MSENKELFSHFASVLPVTDIIKCRDYYRDKLGFKVNFEWNEPIEYVVLKRGDNVSIHLTKRGDQLKPSRAHNCIYVFVHDVDAVYQEFQEKNVMVTNPIADRDYGMRDFDVVDPEGHILAFGMGIS